ncbi:hypothetical protein HCY98_11030 [Limosilactobacillus fermentum]
MRSRNIAWIIWHDKLLSRFSTILPDSADTRQVLRVFAIPILILAKFEGEAYQIRYKFTTRVEDMVA